MARHDAGWSIACLREIARKRLPRPVFDFYEGGAEDELTLRANEAAFRQAKLVPRVLVDVSHPKLAVDVLGVRTPLPLAIAPLGAAGFAWRDGDVALARAAAAAGIPYTLSTMASATIEELAQKAAGRLWFQAHLLQPRERTLALIERARAAQYEALVVTLDLAVGGRRERDLRNGVAMPMRIRPRHWLAFACRPAWSLEMLRRGVPQMPNATPPASSSASSVGAASDASFDWHAMRSIRDAWPGKLIVKGILHPEDAHRAVEIGVDGIVVSNHGGRQLDGCIATLEALPAIAAATAGRASLMLDGGIRRGRDVLKALLSGADSVLLGRAALYGLAAGGEAGATHAIELLRRELTVAMQLCGIPDLASLDRSGGSLSV